MSFIGCVVIRKSVWNQRKKEEYFGSWFVYMGVIFQDVLDGIKGMSDSMIMIRYGNASWNSKSFEISLLKWPELKWSFDKISNDAKAKVVTTKPWNSLGRLLLFRARGAYSLMECNRFIRDRVQPKKKILLWAVSVFPGYLINNLFLIYFNVLRHWYADWKMQISDLKTSRFNFKK